MGREGGFHFEGGGGVHPPSGAEFLEAPKAPKKIFDWPKARSKIWPNHLKGGGGLEPPPPPPTVVCWASVCRGDGGGRFAQLQPSAPMTPPPLAALTGFTFSSHSLTAKFGGSEHTPGERQGKNNANTRRKRGTEGHPPHAQRKGEEEPPPHKQAKEAGTTDTRHSPPTRDGGCHRGARNTKDGGGRNKKHTPSTLHHI